MEHTKISKIKTLVFVVFLCLLTAAAPAAVIDEYGDIVGMIVDDIIRAMPRRGTERFVVPTLEEREVWREVVRALLAGDEVSADQILQANKFPYDVVRFTESSTEQIYLILRERIPVPNGWGTYVFTYPGEERYPMIVESPHPLFDTATGAQGVEYFRDLGARAFLLAGTHRCANQLACGGADCPAECDAPSDCARGGTGAAASTMFQVVHEELALWDTNLRAVQLHGNADKEVPALVISNGVLERFGPTAVSSVSERICEVADIFFTDPPVQAYDRCDVYGRDTTRLGGNRNPQGHFSNQIHPAPPGSELPFEPGYFLHTEQKLFVRTEESTRMRDVIDVVFGALTASSVESFIIKSDSPDAVRVVK